MYAFSKLLTTSEYNSYSRDILLQKTVSKQTPIPKSQYQEGPRNTQELSISFADKKFLQFVDFSRNYTIHRLVTFLLLYDLPSSKFNIH